MGLQTPPLKGLNSSNKEAYKLSQLRGLQTLRLKGLTSMTACLLFFKELYSKRDFTNLSQKLSQQRV